MVAGRPGFAPNRPPQPANHLTPRYKGPPLLLRQHHLRLQSSRISKRSSTFTRVLSVALSAQMAAPISLVALAATSGDPDCSKCNDDVNKCDCK